MDGLLRGVFVGLSSDILALYFILLHIESVYALRPIICFFIVEKMIRFSARGDGRGGDGRGGDGRGGEIRII